MEEHGGDQEAQTELEQKCNEVEQELAKVRMQLEAEQQHEKILVIS